MFLPSGARYPFSSSRLITPAIWLSSSVVEAICITAIDGYDLELTKAVAEAIEMPVIASGGAGKFEHFYQAFTMGEADAALAASVFHYKEFTIEATKHYLKERGLAVRI